tara:strand:- start:1330 stop:1530 length:201 start_codon:yes stop_codon:yes gene_type:complete
MWNPFMPTVAESQAFRISEIENGSALTAFVPWWTQNTRTLFLLFGSKEDRKQLHDSTPRTVMVAGY